MFVTIKAVAARPLHRALACVVFVGIVAGCTNQPGLFPNSDPRLRKTSTQFAADAARRHYEADAPTTTPTYAQAQIDYQTKNISLENLTDTDWTNVEVWIDQKFVLFIPVMEKQTAKSLTFDMFFDSDGNFFTEYGQTPLKPTIDIYRDGKLFTSIPYTLPDH
jgi:hypothetical protein